VTTSAILRSLLSPTDNPLTDDFGAYRDWGATDPYTKRPGWTHDAGYRPIHYGVDFSARPHAQIVAPCDGQAYGLMSRDRAIGALTLFIPHRDGRPIDDAIIYLIHCEPTASRWETYKRGQALTQHAGHGIGYPHLHLEVAVSMAVYADLTAEGVLEPWPVSDDEMAARAKLSGLHVWRTLAAVRAQFESDRIDDISRDAIIRSVMPKEKQSRFSRVGREMYAVVNPLKLIGGDYGPTR
jgi:hypothetical protein